MRIYLLVVALLAVADAKGGCRGNKGWGKRGERDGPPPPGHHGDRGPPGGDHGPRGGDHEKHDRPSEKPPRKPVSLLNSTGAQAVKPLLDKRAHKLWEAFEVEVSDSAKAAWAKDGHNATSKLAIVFGVVISAAERATGDAAASTKVAAAVWNALPPPDREKHAETWAEYEGDSVLLLALALKVMRSPGADVEIKGTEVKDTEGNDAEEGVPSTWLTIEEAKGIYEADLEATASAWEQEGEEAPATEDATRLLVGCVSIASSVEDCRVQADWARKCQECEQEARMRDESNEPPSPPWLIAAIALSASLGLASVVCVGCLVRGKMKAAEERKLKAEAPVWPESKLAGAEGKCADGKFAGDAKLQSKLAGMESKLGELPIPGVPVTGTKGKPAKADLENGLGV